MNANVRLSDLDVRHQVGLSRLSASTSRKVIALLDRSETDLVRRIEAAGWEDASRAATKVARLEKLLEGIRGAQRAVYAEAGRTLRADLVEVATYEGRFQATAVEAAARKVVVTTQPTLDVLRAAVDSRPFQGRLLKEWGRDLDDAAFKRVRDAIRVGFVEGESVAQIVTRIRGTKAACFKDGITEISRRDAEGLVRTAVTHTASAAKDAFFKANGSVFRGVRWNSVLDGRTTAICRARSGKVYPIDSGPRPPAHWNCRSTVTAVLHGEADEGDAPTYADWLKRQDAETQDDVLGKAKGALFRRGGLPLDRFVDRTGAEYTLADLRRREEAAFQRAGIGR